MKLSGARTRAILLLIGAGALVGCGGSSGPDEVLNGAGDPSSLLIYWEEPSGTTTPFQVWTWVEDPAGVDAIESLLRQGWDGIASMRILIYYRSTEPDPATDIPTYNPAPVYLTPYEAKFFTYFLPCQVYGGPTWVAVEFLEDGGSRSVMAGPARLNLCAP